jgi:hypothetical protein
MNARLLLYILLAEAIAVYSSRRIPNQTGKSYHSTLLGVPQKQAVHSEAKQASQVPNNCDKIDWAVWQTVSGKKARGTINDKGKKVGLTIYSNFDFSFANDIWGYNRFNRYASPMPNTTVPTFTWTRKPGGKITMCFSKTVKDPVLMIATLGRTNTSDHVTIRFSKPYTLVYDGGGMEYKSSTSIKGMEGYAVVRFKGDFTCVTIVASNYEEYTHFTWGLPACEEEKPLPKPVVKPVPPKPVPKPAPKAEPKPQRKKDNVTGILIAKPITETQGPETIISAPSTIKSLVTEKSLRVQIWDFDCMDYDSVALKFNGVPVGPKAILLPLYKRDSPEYTYTLDLLPGNNTLEIHAISDGIKPLLSIGLLIMYHDRRGKVYYKLKSGETMILNL